MISEKHAKRTPEFLLEIRRLMDGLQTSTLSAMERRRVCEILYLNTTDSSCILNAKDGEPIFTLLARDLTSDALIQEWIQRLQEWVQRVEQDRVKQHPAEPVPDKLNAKLADAMMCAAEMRAWPDRKMPE
jgi:hypothetical protein